MRSPSPTLFTETTGTTIAPAHARARNAHNFGTSIIITLLLATSVWYGYDAGAESGSTLVGVFYGVLCGVLCEGFAMLSFRGLQAATGRSQMVLSGIAMLLGAGAGAVISLAKISEVFTADNWVSTALVTMSAVAIAYAYLYAILDAMGIAILKLRVHANRAIFEAIGSLQDSATQTAIEDVSDDAAIAFSVLIASAFRSILPATTNREQQAVQKFRSWTSRHWQSVTDRAFTPQEV